MPVVKVMEDAQGPNLVETPVVLEIQGVVRCLVTQPPLQTMPRVKIRQVAEGLYLAVILLVRVHTIQAVIWVVVAP